MDPSCACVQICSPECSMLYLHEGVMERLAWHTAEPLKSLKLAIKIPQASHFITHKVQSQIRCILCV